MVSITFLVPTAGRPELRVCLASLAYQIVPGDECLVIGDTHDGPLPEVEAMVHAFGPQFRYVAYDAGRHAYGHPQLDYGITHARGDYLSFQDDDDIWTPDAVSLIHSAIESMPGRPLLFRFVNYHGFMVWLERGLFEEGYIGGHCLVCPNRPAKLGVWSDNYTGDWSFVSRTVELFGGLPEVAWLDDVIAISRPPADVVRETWRLFEIRATSRSWPVVEAPKIITEYIARATRRIFLDVGSHHQQAPGWKVLDASPGSQIVHEPLDFPWPLADNSVYYVRCLQFIQHIPQACTNHSDDPFLEFLTEAYRVLEPGGILWLTFPYAFTRAAWADPTNRRVISGDTIGIASAETRRERGLEHLRISCDFHVSHGFVTDTQATILEVHAELTKRA